MLTATQPPWHMWGNSVITPAIAFNQVLTQQVAKISYGRPESWNFYFGVRIVSGPPAQAPGAATMFVLWDVQFGLGRSVSIIQGFEQYTVNWLTQPPVSQAALIYSTSVSGPVRDNSVGAPPPNMITELVAQEIQVSARVTLTNSVSPTAAPLVVELTSMWAPKTHIRPEWYLLDKELAEQYPGGEIGGR